MFILFIWYFLGHGVGFVQTLSALAGFLNPTLLREGRMVGGRGGRLPWESTPHSLHPQTDRTSPCHTLMALCHFTHGTGYFTDCSGLVYSWWDWLLYSWHWLLYSLLWANLQMMPLAALLMALAILFLRWLLYSWHWVTLLMALVTLFLVGGWWVFFSWLWAAFTHSTRYFPMTFLFKALAIPLLCVLIYLSLWYTLVMTLAT
jgi:hypothetical protein